MTVTEVATLVEGTMVGATTSATRDVGGGYASDLLSDVMGNARDRDVWVTLQKHINIVAVAELRDLAAIVIVNGRRPDPETLARAVEHGVAVVVTPLSAFDVAGRLYGSGVRGRTAS